MTSTVLTKEACPCCGRPNEEYNNIVASSKNSNGAYVTWLSDQEKTKHVIFFDTCDNRGQLVFTDNVEAAATYHHISREIV